MEPSGYATAITLTPPPELNGSVPRRAQMDYGDARYLLTVVMLFFVGGLIFFGLLGHEDFKSGKELYCDVMLLRPRPGNWVFVWSLLANVGQLRVQC
ncbi:MAG: hypothetical protein JST28_09675 [Acidobacteria bacterium]|nr:hypothetical protein [Acidobacteriota bacterium]